MIITNQNACRLGRPKQKGFTLDPKKVTEQIALSVLDNQGRPTDEVVNHSVSRIVESTEMPIDQTLDADLFSIKSMIENGLQMQPVNGFAISPEAPEAVMNSLSETVDGLVNLENKLKAKHSPKTAEPAPTEPASSEPFIQTSTNQ